ncbi:endonuclease/exonuclease/phosphatase family protein [Actinomadura graeca]|uniref:Endonuclease/exonuclease/phosphatase family protein n=1 Tax=Actinomadura graeca TaxID=2750812 RepID=A0ABX8QY80_9ACTN|nr:endonuclease/exonuclease/phosphatase family protein [Actinomadura graeca]QXJ22944.1 endonuclease/exonuclease/phosphatase family protein [Actinomadura graeca]
MRVPRALIPLLSVCGAAAVVAAAGAGAAIDGLPGGGPAHADGARGVSAVTVKVTTWNVCGTPAPGCPLGADPAALTRRIVQQVGGTEAGGHKGGPAAVFLQEVCSGQVQALKKSGRRWNWAFAPFTGAPSCAAGQGRPGVAVGAQAPLTGVRTSPLPSPSRTGRVAVCGDVPSWNTRLCATQFSVAGEDPSGEWRRKQVDALGTLAGTGVRAVVGGDLSDSPGSAVLDPLYRSYDECDQGAGGARSGAGTAQDWRGAATEKTDYLFVSKGAAASCAVPAAPVASSDHRPLSAVIRFR